jgi:membrane-bound ClpP family serine protease
MDKKNLAFDRINYILLVVGMVIVVIGFILMSGAGSTESAYNPDIFSTRRIKVAPVVCLIGFVSMIYAVMHKPKDKEETK